MPPTPADQFPVFLFLAPEAGEQFVQLVTLDVDAERDTKQNDDDDRQQSWLNKSFLPLRLFVPSPDRVP